MSFRLSPAGTEYSLVLTDPALAMMLCYRQVRVQDKEAGGQLFARFDGRDVVVVEATPPKLLDYRTRHSFHPNRFLQRKEIMSFYRKGLHFVGDWHTHPEPMPSPSADDIAGIKDCFQRSTHDLAAFVLLIVGTDQPPLCFYASLVGANGAQVLRYTPDTPPGGSRL